MAALPKADPRLRLRFMLGAELRPLQVLRSRRSNIELEGGMDGLGTFTVRGDGHKGGAVVDLDADMRAEWDAAVGPTGYLRRLEAAYQAGEIVDYFLFPLGRLVYAGEETPAAPVERALKGHMDAGTMNDFWRAFEKLAGVDHVAGRGMYGVRRLAVDLADDLTDDEDAKNAVGGWALGSPTRKRVYAAKQRRERNEKAAKVRSGIRRVMRGDD